MDTSHRNNIPPCEDDDDIWYWGYSIFVPHIPDTRAYPYVSRIMGPDPKYRFARKFLQYQWPPKTPKGRRFDVELPGDGVYDAEFGWGLYDFIQSEDTELTRLEITQRVRLKLQKREVVLPESIEISIAFEDDAVVLHCSFRFAEEDERRELDVIIGAVSVEVVSE